MGVEKTGLSTYFIRRAAKDRPPFNVLDSNSASDKSIVPFQPEISLIYSFDWFASPILANSLLTNRATPMFESRFSRTARTNLTTESKCKGSEPVSYA